jgi:hypothetical protein
MFTACVSSYSASASIKSNASLSAGPLNTPTPSLYMPTMSSWRWLPVVPWERIGRATGWPFRCAYTVPSAVRKYRKWDCA